MQAWGARGGWMHVRHALCWGCQRSFTCLGVSLRAQLWREAGRYWFLAYAVLFFLIPAARLPLLRSAVLSLSSVTRGPC